MTTKSKRKNKPKMLDDGFGNIWVNWCDKCKSPSLEIVRPGKVQCYKCG